MSCVHSLSRQKECNFPIPSFSCWSHLLTLGPGKMYPSTSLLMGPAMLQHSVLAKMNKDSLGKICIAELSIFLAQIINVTIEAKCLEENKKEKAKSFGIPNRAFADSIQTKFSTYRI